MPRALGLQRFVGLVVALVLAVLAGQALGREARSSSPSAATARPAATAAVDDGATETGASVPLPSSAPSTALSAGPSGTVATRGPGLTEPGIHVVAQPDATGDLEVLEQVRLAAPVRRLRLEPLHASGSGVSAATPTVTGFQATADGAVVSGAPASPMPRSGEWLQLPAPATDISMRYRVEGAASRSQPAPAGRALVVLPPLTAASPEIGATMVVVEVVGTHVRNLVCPDLPAAEQLCGRQQGAVWTTTAFPLGRSVVVAQVDLPAPGDR